MTWAVKTGWRFEAIEIVKETAQAVSCPGYGGRITRLDKSKLMDWRGSEDAAHALAAKLTSAAAEYERRRKAAREWFKKRQAKILAEAGRTDPMGDK